MQRVRIAISGAVQGVGFRPFVYRLAQELGVNGYIINTPSGVTVEVEAAARILRPFLERLEVEKPPRSFMQSVEKIWLEPKHYDRFEIRQSSGQGAKTAVVLPDLATCDDCVRELFDPADRRYRYPFINCTQCGPRYSIVRGLPYDRPNTTMSAFTMCARCNAEYHDPAHRRFHAQPNACPDCGPQFELWDAAGRLVASRDDALDLAASAISAGQIVAVKGIGGFHLFTDAANEAAVQLLRQRKHREEKPFAVMFPGAQAVSDVCHCDDMERQALTSAAAPIVLLRRRSLDELPWIAPGNCHLGVVLPYTPIHHLLMHNVQRPVVATSGNLHNEPICTEELDALRRLRGIADLFLVHNREIVRHVDDSIVRVVLGHEMVVRRARGFAPLPVARIEGSSQPTLALGGHMKNSVALTVGDTVVMSQHVGDLESEAASAALRRVAADLQSLYDVTAVETTHDLHPDYVSTRLAGTLARQLHAVQHHYAHALSCMLENELTPPVLAVTWDGTGYGLDGSIWGGEFLSVTEGGFERFASLRQFRMPGGDHGAREPRRAAAGLLFERFGTLDDLPPTPTLKAFSPRELPAIRTMLRRGIYSPYTTSMGRLFDAVASLSGLRQRARFEGQAAMELECAATRAETTRHYPFTLERGPATPHAPTWIMDWAALLDELLTDVAAGKSQSVIAAKFHHTLPRMIVAVAERAGMTTVALTGGCFQNELLLTASVGALRRAGFRPFWHQRVPTNDGGLAVGQLAAAIRAQRASNKT